MGPPKWDLEVTQKIVFDSPVVSHLSIFFASGLNDFPISVNLTSFFPLTSKYWKEGLDIFLKRVDKLNLNLLFFFTQVEIYEGTYLVFRKSGSNYTDLNFLS